ncbi:alpha-tectorin-like [Enoplosus armatus]|uniref:alpha-tectorin-like n=1 Tax=Enoplosus armatus TaxID=215367 RepID=UPI0039940B93
MAKPGALLLLLAGVPLAISSNKIKPETCTKVTCDAYAALTSDSTCGPTEVCRGDNECYEPINVCTVTGSTVVDFFSRVQSVPDRCVYTLLKTKGMQILAGFQERRRKDVAFLDHLVILLNGPGVKIYLEQGGRVRVDDQMLMLNATARSVQGVELSKDQTGVTAKTPFSKVTVFFDGNTAHVKVKGLQALGGLCGNTNTPSQTTTLTAEKSSPLSAAGCEVQHKDEVAICNRSAEYCNLLDTPPFTDCHNESDPKPFISACRETLCKYSDVDSLKCQFLEAYAKTCHLKNVTLGAWRSQASCPAVPQAFCLDQYCSPHEFCGEKVSGETRCFCRAIFASKYKPTNSLGDPTVCMQNSATVALADCLLEEKDIDSSTLHLNDEKCKGQLDSLTHMVIFSYNSSETCGSEIVMTDTQIVYKNTIMSRNSSAYGVITRQDQVKIDFSCLYKAPDMRRLAFKIKDGSVVQKIVSGIWNYTLMMNAYTDSSRTSLVTSKTEITLNEKIWLELKTEGLDANMIALVTDSCWATNQLSPTSSLRYDLIIDGCPNPADNTVNVKGNGLGTSNYFSFDMFEFSGKSSEIYLHCKLELCTANQGPSCAPVSPSLKSLCETT